jgi:hypothetical protein
MFLKNGNDEISLNVESQNTKINRAFANWIQMASNINQVTIL